MLYVSRYFNFSGQQAHKPKRRSKCLCCLPLMISLTSPSITPHALFAMTSCAKLSARSIFSKALMNQSKLKALIQHIEQTIDPGPNPWTRCLWVGRGWGELGWVGFTCWRSSACPQASKYWIWTGDLQGVTVLGPVRLRDWPRAGLRRAGSQGSGSRPVQLVSLLGIKECQGLASSFSSNPLHHFSPLGYQQSAGSRERWSNRKQSCFLTLLFSLALRGCQEGVCASECLQ